MIIVHLLKTTKMSHVRQGILGLYSAYVYLMPPCPKQTLRTALASFKCKITVNLLLSSLARVKILVKVLPHFL